MNVQSDITAGRRAATPAPTQSDLINILHEAQTSFHLSMAATLLFRDLVLSKPRRDGAVTIGIEHAEMMHSVMDLAWGRSREVIEALEPFCEAGR